MLDELFARFLEEKTYLQNCTPITVDYYKKCFKAYRSVVTEPSLPTKEDTHDFVVGVRKRGMSVGCANTYIRGLNTFFGWLHSNQLTPEKLRIDFLKREKRMMRAFTDEELRKLISFRPETFADRRLHALICALIDTGCRINEVLSMERGRIDWDGLIIVVRGKGRKERIVPISIELRRVLYKFLSRHKFDLAFPSRDGKKLCYTNVWRDFKHLCKRLGIKPAGFHCLRRTFARNYIRGGGNLFYLQTAMGHSKLETTRLYVEVEVEALREMHLKTSILSRLR